MELDPPAWYASVAFIRGSRSKQPVRRGRRIEGSMKPSRGLTLCAKCVLGFFLAMAIAIPEIRGDSTLPTISINDVTVTETINQNTCQGPAAVFTVTV